MQKLSALMDGELPSGEMARVLAEVRREEALREAWVTYHLIGEALRREPCGECKVLAPVAQRLAQEPTVLAPRRAPAAAAKRWALPSLAAAAAVVSVSWMVAHSPADDVNDFVQSPMIVPAVGVATLPFPDLQPVNLSAQTPAPAAIQLQGRELDAYLMAHQQVSPSATLYGLAPFARTVSTAPGETER